MKTAGWISVALITTPVLTGGMRRVSLFHNVLCCTYQYDPVGGHSFLVFIVKRFGFLSCGVIATICIVLSMLCCHLYIGKESMRIGGRMYRECCGEHT